MLELSVDFPTDMRGGERDCRNLPTELYSDSPAVLVGNLHPSNISFEILRIGDQFRIIEIMNGALDQIDTSIRVVTPENIAFRYQLAGPFRRFHAFVIDFALRVALMIFFVLLVTLLSSVAPGFSQAILLTTWFVMSWFYGGLFETYLNGQTPGKWILGIRVLTVDGRPITGMQAVLRNILRAADMFPPPGCLVGLVCAASNRHFQRLGDLAAGTIVVIEERKELVGVVHVEDQRAIALAARLPVGIPISRSLARCLNSYVERRRYLAPSQQREIAGHLAQLLLYRYGLPADTSYDLLLCALYYRTFVTDRVEAENYSLELDSPSQSPTGSTVGH